MAFVSGVHQGTYRGAAVTKTTANVFIPELWGSEVKRERDANLIASRYVKSLSGQFTKGDRLNIPLISRAAVNAKLPETPVMLQARTEGNMTVDIDRYMESSFMIEDIVAIQSSYNLRSEYTREAGYALARDLDNYILALRAVIFGTNVVAGVPSFGTAITAQASQRVVSTNTAGTVIAPLNYTALLAAKLQLDKAAVPDSDRVIVTGAIGYNQLLAVDKFISMDYRNQASVQTGQVGTLFGMPVIMTANMVPASATGYYNGGGSSGAPTPGSTGSSYLPTQDTYTALYMSGTTAIRNYNGVDVTSVAYTDGTLNYTIMMHKDAFVLATQKTPSTESSRETLYLADALVTSQLYGGRVYRPDHAVVIMHDSTIPSVA